MNRITRTFDALRKQGRKGLVGYLTAGDPDGAASECQVREALDAGLDVLELGIPFSDPTADGPTIQAASHRALASGMTVTRALELVARLRADYDTPIVLFGYANPFFLYGYESLCADAAGVGADGLLIVDLPFEEADEVRPYVERNGLCLVPLIAPTTPEARAKRVLSGASGFVYYIMVTGVTGARAGLAEGVVEHVQTLRRCTDLPIAVGFGVSSGEQAAVASRFADAVVVGSALVRAAQDGSLDPLVRELRESLDAASEAGPMA